MSEVLARRDDLFLQAKGGCQAKKMFPVVKKFSLDWLRCTVLA